jgi:hypothetical protein
MKAPRPQPPQEPRQVTVAYLNAEDWREKFWTCIETLLPQRREEPVPEEEPQPPRGAA